MYKILAHEIKSKEFNIWITFYQVGEDIIITIFNENMHLGAVSSGMYDERHGRAYSSVLTYPGHRDDDIAKEVARQAAKITKRNVCAIAGIHIEGIMKDTIDNIMKYIREEVPTLLDQLKDRII
jgi:hypothetical protein